MSVNTHLHVHWRLYQQQICTVFLPLLPSCTRLPGNGMCICCVPWRMPSCYKPRSDFSINLGKIFLQPLVLISCKLWSFKIRHAVASHHWQHKWRRNEEKLQVTACDSVTRQTKERKQNQERQISHLVGSITYMIYYRQYNHQAL